MPFKIAIVEENSALCAKLEPYVARLAPTYSLASYETGEKTLSGIAADPPDAALVSFQLPFMDGFECARKIKAALPKLPVLMFATDLELESPKGRVENEMIFAAVHASAAGFLPKDLSPFEILNAIEQVGEGMRRNCRTFLMFFNSDRSLALTAQYWDKIATLVGAPSATIAYGRKWRTVTFVGKLGLSSLPTSVPCLEPARQLARAQAF